MKINISNLSEGSHKFEFNEKPSSVRLDERFIKPVLVKVELERRSTQFFLTGHVTATGRFACDRCLEDFEKEISLNYRMTYVYDRLTRAGKEHEADADRSEVTVIERGTNEIGIDDDVKQFVLLSIPLKLLCNENCAGLCSTCGANLNYEKCRCKKSDVESDERLNPPRLRQSNS